MIINGEASSLFEELKDMPGLKDSVMGAIKEDESVVRILKDRTRVIRNNGVPNRGGERRVLKQTTQDVCYNDEQVRRERVTLPKPVAAIDPGARNAIEKDCRLASDQEITNPPAPLFREASAPEYLIKAIPIDTIKSFMEIQLKHDCG
jgi:hypothetical protein